MKRTKEMDESYQKAKKKVEAMRGFYIHLIVYICVNLLLLVVNLLTTPRFLWFLFPLFGWGIGLFFHGFGVFGTNKILGKEWEEKKIKEIIEKDKSKIEQ